MAARIKADTSELEEIIANFQKFTTQSIPTLVRRHARLLAVELANRTQPFSSSTTSGSLAQIRGKHAVENDINKVFRTRKTLQQVVDKTQNEKLKERLQKLLNSGDVKKIATVFKQVGMINDFEVIPKSGLREKHQSQRSKKTGRTWNSRKNMLINTSGIPTYVKEVQKRVGMSKSAWSECAEYIGGVQGDPQRGIPAFAKNKDNKVKGSIVDGIKSKNPYITMTSRLPWASRVLPPSEIKFAQYLVRNKMMKQANYIIKHAAKKNFQPEALLVDE